MARIPMTSGFTLIPEGTYVFRVYGATYDEEFGKIEVKLVNAAGMTHTERFSIKDKNDELNEKALNAFSYFAKTVMGDYTLRTLTPLSLSTTSSAPRSFTLSSRPTKTPTRWLLSPILVTSPRQNTSTLSLSLVL